MIGTQTDGRLLRGEQTRRLILQRAVNIASVDGLEGLSIGRLATELKVSKSGVFTHFGSKEELQLATVRAAAAIFIAEVVRPAEQVPPGLRRVWLMCERRLGYMSRPVFAGGCFFYAATAEFDTRPGRVRDEIAAHLRRWRKKNADDILEAKVLGEIAEDTDVEGLAFELDAYARAGGGDALLHDDPGAITRTRTIMLARLRSVATDPSILPVPA
ncbi:TetR/AcrR family transcriptional regulator [Sphaerisporangium perillae]|uniref:TetR/AcrR family transcriptional regulator n=1 Tax=Sphaerisporangium perillae TaxID=2935860 RepID=UPI00200BE6D1|nr:TetR/AcrR family transcriptional regulator [Sphaerisporangium perillae]